MYAVEDINDKELDEIIGEEPAEELREELEMVEVFMMLLTVRLILLVK